MPPSVHVAKAMSGSWLWCCFKIWEQLHYRPISSHTPRFLGETRKGRQSPGVPIRWAHRAETQVDRRLDQKSPKTPGSKNRWRFWNPKSSDVLLYFCRTSRPDPSWINISSPRGPFGRYFGRDWKWSSPVARQASRSPQKAHQELPKMMLMGFWDIPKMPRLVHFSVWSGPCFIQLCFSPASAQLTEKMVRSAEFFLSCPGGILHCFQKRRFINLQKLNVIFQNRRSYSETMSDSETCFCCIEKLTPLVPHILFSNYI